MGEKLFSLFNDNPTLITHCPVCNVRYNPIEARILEEGQSSHLVFIKCRECVSAVLAVIVSNNMGISSIGLITDLSAEDIAKFKLSGKVSVDDIIEAHQFLTKEKVVIDHLVD
jgi:DNA-directed RNA polymerase alpha subunit